MKLNHTTAYWASSVPLLVGIYLISGLASMLLWAGAMGLLFTAVRAAFS